jgi:hypothetical protein
MRRFRVHLDQFRASYGRLKTAPKRSVSYYSKSVTFFGETGRRQGNTDRGFKFGSQSYRYMSKLCFATVFAHKSNI